MANELVPDPRSQAELVASASSELPFDVSGMSAQPMRQPPSGKSRYLAALGRYKWLIVGVSVLGIAATAVVSRFFHPKYMAQSTIWVEVPNRDDGRSGPIQQSELLASTAWLDLLRSYQVMDYVVREQRLYLDYETGDAGMFREFKLNSPFHSAKYSLVVSRSGRTYTLNSDDGAISEHGTRGDSIGRGAGFFWLPNPQALRPGREVTFTVSAPRDAARALNDKLQAVMPKNGNFLSVGLLGEDPYRTTAVVNAIVDRYVAVAAELKAGKMTEIAKILDSQVGIAANNLHDAESAMEAFKVSNATTPSDAVVSLPSSSKAVRGSNGADAEFSHFFDVKIQREQLTRDEEAIRSALTGGANGGPAVDALAVIGSVQQSPELNAALQDLTQKRAALRALQQQYTDDYVAVRRAKEEIAVIEHQTVPRLASALVSALQMRATVLDNMVANASSDLKAIPARVINEARLQRRVSGLEELYNNVQSRYESTRLAAETSIPDVRVLDRAAVPREPDSDPRIKLLLLGIVGSIGLGLVLALLLDRLDPHVRYPEEVTFHMGLPILGVLPHLQMTGGAMAQKELTQALESLRTIRLNLLHAYGAAGPMVVTVTSPGTGEGKSFLISNLAIAFADQGFRTLVIDGDIRRGTMHHLLKFDRKPGLTDLLEGRATDAEVLHGTQHERLHCIASGTRMHNGPELLASAAMRQLLARMRTQYDAILIDSPPLAAGVDPFVLATLAGNLLLVIRTGRTERALAHTHLDNLTRVSTRVLGVVLNGTREQSIYRYYRYLPGYDSGNEEAEPKQLQPAV